MQAHEVVKYIDYVLLQEDWGENILIELGERFQIVYFGGAIRDCLYSYEGAVRDVDIVLRPMNVRVDQEKTLRNIIENAVEPVKVKRNQFGGYKLIGQGIKADIWLLKDTWAYKQKLIAAGLDNLLKTVYLNIDAYAVLRDTERFLADCDRKIYDCIDVVLEKSPCEDLNLLRAIVYSRKYGMNLSAKLLDKIAGRYPIWKEEHEGFNDMQIRHYGQTVLTIEAVRSIVG